MKSSRIRCRTILIILLAFILISSSYFWTYSYLRKQCNKHWTFYIYYHSMPTSVRGGVGGGAFYYYSPNQSLNTLFYYLFFPIKVASEGTFRSIESRLEDPRDLDIESRWYHLRDLSYINDSIILQKIIK
jgi:hypothetical protein